MDELPKKISYISLSEHVQLRDAAPLRLIELKSHRDGEPSRLLISD